MNSTTQAKKWAILIGIDFYIKENNRLKGCVQDAEDIHKFLNEYHQDTNITTFLAQVTGDSEQKVPSGEKSSWPTFENIIAKLQNVTSWASSGDFVYIHYSGHGTRRSIRDEKEKYRNFDRNDSAIVLFDEDRGECYLRGFQLAGLLDNMVKKGLIVTMVLDCCHSGGVTRGNARFRGLVWEDDKDFRNKENTGLLNNMLPVGPKERNDGNYRDGYVDEHWLLKPRNYALLAACGSLEKAEEHLFETGKFHGVFTYNLLQLLRSAGPPKSHKLIHRELCVQFHDLWPAQHPVLLGNLDAILFGGSGTREAYSEVSCNILRKEGNKIVLNQGWVHGICVDDEYELHSYKFEPIQMEKLFVQVQIVRDFEVETELVDEYGQPDIRIDKVGIGWHARPITYHPKISRVKLGFDTTKPEWKDAIERSCWLQVSKNNLPDPNSYVIKINAQDEYEIQRNEQTFNMPTISTQYQDAISRTVTNLEHLVKYARVEKLRSKTEGKLAEKFDIRRKQSENEIIRIANGEKIRIIMKNTSSGPLYVSVYNLTPLYKIQRLWPSDKYCSEIASMDGRTIIPTMTIPKQLLDKGRKEADDILKFFVTTKRHDTLDSLSLPDCAANEHEPLRSVESQKSRTDFHNAIKGLGERYRGAPLDAKDEEWYTENLVIRTFVE